MLILIYKELRKSKWLRIILVNSLIFNFFMTFYVNYCKKNPLNNFLLGVNFKKSTIEINFLFILHILENF